MRFPPQVLEVEKFAVEYFITLGSFDSYHTNRRVGSFLIHTDLEVFFFLRASHHVLVICEKPPNQFIFVLGLFRAVSRHFCHKTLNAF